MISQFSVYSILKISVCNAWSLNLKISIEKFSTTLRSFLKFKYAGTIKYFLSTDSVLNLRLSVRCELTTFGSNYIWTSNWLDVVQSLFWPSCGTLRSLITAKLFTNIKFNEVLIAVANLGLFRPSSGHFSPHITSQKLFTSTIDHMWKVNQLVQLKVNVFQHAAVICSSAIVGRFGADVWPLAL